MCGARAGNLAKGKCLLPYSAVGDADRVVWDDIKELLSDPRAIETMLMSTQAVLKEQDAGSYHQIADIDELIIQRSAELDTLVYSLHTAKGALLVQAIQRQADELAATIEGLEAQKGKTGARLNPNILSTQDIAALAAVAEKVQPKLEYATFQDKCDIIDALKFSFELAFEDGLRVVYILWHTYQFRLTMGHVNSTENSLISSRGYYTWHSSWALCL